MPGRHESARIQPPSRWPCDDSAVPTEVTSFVRPQKWRRAPRSDLANLPKCSLEPAGTQEMALSTSTGTKKRKRTSRKEKNMGDVVPINKQGRFNLGPGTAPRPSTPKPEKYVRPREVNVCWACGTKKPVPGEKYCVACIKAGRDNPMIECMYFDECHTMAKRRYKGQQYFICPRHKETPA